MGRSRRTRRSMPEVMCRSRRAEARGLAGAVMTGWQAAAAARLAGVNPLDMLIVWCPNPVLCRALPPRGCRSASTCS